MDKNTQANSQNIIMGPDYGQLIKSQTNSAIIEHFLSFLFSKNTKLNPKSLVILMRNLVIMIVIKTILEDSKTYLDQIKLTNINVFRYFYQWIRYSEITYDFVLVNGKWKYNTKNIAINTLTPFLEQRSVYISQPATYYWNYREYLIKIIVTGNKITFAAPNIEFINKYIENDIIHKHEEVLFGGKTSISRLVIMGTAMVKMETVQLAYAFATDNYLHLEECIKNTFLVDSILKTANIPFCVNFDGKPGTGKTTFGNYIASSGIFNRIIICNLVQASSLNFQDLITSIDRQINSSSSKEKLTFLDDETENILLIFDEIDKWLESYIENQINKLRDEARSKKKSKDDKNNTIIESHEKLSVQEENDKRTHLKNQFLDQLYKLVEGTILSDTRKYVIIFNTNHFDKMFDNIDPRYEALRDRFTKYKFEEIGKPQIITYLKSFVEKLKTYKETDSSNQKKQIYSNVIDKLVTMDPNIYNEIPETIKLSYRTLQKILRNNRSNIEQTVRTLCNMSKSEYF